MLIDMNRKYTEAMNPNFPLAFDLSSKRVQSKKGAPPGAEMKQIIVYRTDLPRTQVHLLPSWLTEPWIYSNGGLIIEPPSFSDIPAQCQFISAVPAQCQLSSA